MATTLAARQIPQSRAEPTGVDERLDLVALWNLFSEYRWTILATAVVFGALATTYAMLATQIFRAEVTVTLVKDQSNGGAGGLASQLGGIASLAGVNLGDTSGEEEAYRAVLASRHLIGVFIERYGLLQVLQGKDKRPPTLWKAINSFHDNVLSIREDQRKGVTIIAMNWNDPVVAARWANDFLALANEMIRDKALNEAKRNVDYLTAQTAHTNSIEVQRAMFTLVESETKKLMLANERIEYAFSVADPAVAPEIRASPKRTLLVAVALGIGLFVGTSIAFIRSRLRARRGQPASELS